MPYILTRVFYKYGASRTHTTVTRSQGWGDAYTGLSTGPPTRSSLQKSPHSLKQISTPHLLDVPQRRTTLFQRSLDPLIFESQQLKGWSRTDWGSWWFKIKVAGSRG